VFDDGLEPQNNTFTEVIHSSGVYLLQTSKFLFQLRNYHGLILVIETARK